jgi:hypothetical protein
VELLYPGDHRVIAVKDDLVVVLGDDLFDQTVSDQDLRCRVRLSFHPDLDLPPVPVEVGALPFIMEQTVTGIDLHLFIDPKFHHIS